MRMMPSRYLTKAQPVLAKKKVAGQIQHLQAPLKGLSLSSQLVLGDPLKAPILDNWVVEEDKIRVRPGTFLRQTITGPISTIIPYYGIPDDYALASGSKIYSSDGVVIANAMTRDDWAWTSFSNLGDREYTVLCNGADGVWSWDGGNTADPATVAVTSLSNTNPVKCTVAAGDIGKFSNGQTVVIAGATGALAVCNGPHVIGSVGTPANTFTLVGVNGTAAGAPQTSGVTADPPGSLGKEAVTAPPAEGWIVPNLFDKTLSHMNRLWFADSANLAVYYLPVQQKAGVVSYLPLNAIFRRGGHIVAIHNWTLDGGGGMDDTLAIFSSNGECAIYGGTDPDADDFSLVGIFKFDSPMSKNSVMNFGGDIYALVSTGLIPMSSMLRAEGEQLGSKADKDVYTAFLDVSRVHATEFGWGVMLDYRTGAAICNLPLGGGKYKQMVRFMPNPIWSSWSNLNARCWQWVNGRSLYGTDTGKLYEVNKDYLNDAGEPITADVQFAWSLFKTPAYKSFRMVLPYVITDGTPRPLVEIRCDYDLTPPQNWPDISLNDLGAAWDVATWDVDYWVSRSQSIGEWQGVSGGGHVGAPRLRITIKDCTFSLAAIDVLFEAGAAV